MTNELILVLDSNEAARQELCDLILGIGVPEEEILCTGDIEKALEELHKNEVCLVIVEATMPFKEGYSICSLMDINPKAQVVIKAYVEELGPIYTAAVKVHGILEKPVREKNLKFFINKSIQISTICRNLDSILEKMKFRNLGCEDFCPNTLIK